MKGFMAKGRLVAQHADTGEEQPAPQQEPVAGAAMYDTITHVGAPEAEVNTPTVENIGGEDVQVYSFTAEELVTGNVAVVEDTAGVVEQITPAPAEAPAPVVDEAPHTTGTATVPAPVTAAPAQPAPTEHTPVNTSEHAPGGLVPTGYGYDTPTRQVRVSPADVARTIRVSDKLKTLSHDMLVRVTSFFSITGLTPEDEKHEESVCAILNYDETIKVVLSHFQFVAGQDEPVLAALYTQELQEGDATDLYNLFSALTGAPEQEAPKQRIMIALEVYKMLKALDDAARESVRIVEELISIVDNTPAPQ